MMEWVEQALPLGELDGSQSDPSRITHMSFDPSLERWVSRGQLDDEWALNWVQRDDRGRITEFNPKALALSGLEPCSCMLSVFCSACFFRFPCLLTRDFLFAPFCRSALAVASSDVQ